MLFWANEYADYVYNKLFAETFLVYVYILGIGSDPAVWITPGGEVVF